MSNMAHQTTMIEDDDLFTRPPRSARRMPIVQQARRQCRVCDGSYVVALDYDGPPLCDGCRADPAATRTHVQAWLDGVADQESVAADDWLAFAAEHADAWDKVRAGQALPDYAERCARHIAAGNIYGQLIERHAAYERVLAQLGAERARLEKALEAL